MMVDLSDNVQIWNITGHLLYQFKSNPVVAANFSSDNQQLALADFEGKIRLLNLKTRQATDFQVKKPGTIQVDFSIDSQHLHTVNTLGTASTWSRGGRLLENIELNLLLGISTTKISPDHQNLLIDNPSDRTISLKEIKSGRVQTLQAYQSNFPYSDLPVSGFSADGELVMVGEADRTVYFWTRSGQLLAQFKLYHPLLSGLAISRDRRQLVTVGQQGLVKVWDITHLQLNGTTSTSQNIGGTTLNPDPWLPTLQDKNGQVTVPVQPLNQLINQGCDRLKAYFMSHLQELTEYPICQQH